MQSTQLALFAANDPQSSSRRMSPASSPAKTMPSGVSWERLPAKIANSNRQGSDGRTLVVCLDPKEQSRGGSWMPNISSWPRSEEHTSELQSLMRISYAVFCLKNKKRRLEIVTRQRVSKR